MATAHVAENRNLQPSTWSAKIAQTHASRLHFGQFFIPASADT